MAKKIPAPKGKRPVGKTAAKPAAKVAPAKKSKPVAPTKKAAPAKKAAVPAKAVKKAAPVKKVATPAKAAAKAPAKVAPVKAVAKAPAKVALVAKKAAAPTKVAPPAPAKVEVPKEAPAKPVAPVAKAPAPVVKKRPAKERVVMEFYLNSSPNALYDLLSSPSGFSEWYCQDVDVRGDQYTFIWDNEREETTLIGRKLGEVIRFRRNDDDDPEAFFEFRVRIDAMTNEVCLVVTDHAWPDEVDETRNLWTSQIETLGRVLGA